MQETLIQYLVPCAAVFAAGLAGALCKRNVLVVFMCIELMLCSSLAAFVMFSVAYADSVGSAFALFVFAIAACEVAVGLALVVQLFKLKSTVALDRYNSLGD